MAGRINDEDLAAVRDRARIEDVVGSYVALRSAGGGSLKGLCPFHDEKSPSFHVTPSRGFWYCFGACGEGGDAIGFMQKIENLSFSEAVQRLADRVGIQLRFTEDSGPRVEPGLRMRLLEAHREAAEFYADQLSRPDALAARQFLAQRGFDRAAAERFGVGFAPREGRALTQHLKARGYSEADLITGGLTRKGGWDFFTGRVLWPIRDSGKSTVGFGARRIFDDDRLPAKYINTPETPLYKKSQVLYGLDLARLPIGKKSQAVIVEGYTDVMAAHLSGVDTAVASCGTAFGDEHARLLRRLMGNHDAFHGEVIFTFDGDDAGQAAALKVFRNDESFIAQTYVAVDPHGLDPCDLRLQHGEAAVRELVGRRIPLYRFVMSNVLSRYDLDRADGRLGALREAAPLVASVRDAGMVGGYARELAGMLGMDAEEVRAEVNRAAARASKRTADEEPEPTRADPAGEPTGPATRTADVLPDPHDRRLSTERETAKLLVQAPQLFDDDFDGLTAEDFTHPAYAAVLRHARRAAADGGVSASSDWPRRVAAAEDNPWVESLVVALAVEPLLSVEPVRRYVTAHTARLRLLTVMRRIADVKSKLQRTNPVEAQGTYNQMFSELVVLEARRTDLQNLSLGADA
ncbi:DNA primase [Friedmanniella endophytica]|uniref:DNA primase n=1 Tax=Microlunatus kandeliicorticis TaxID=1759536 RepID=A0A7W3IV37_9ACTN|nr:DNA primase [Microlunatus kandeliicorticis]MBA8795797.1 DNA primase [Microlunatus kandeliicorticis]